MYSRTINIPEVMDFIKNKHYKHLPVELFDRYLWFYNSLEKLSHDVVYGKQNEPYYLYSNYVNNEIVSVAYLDHVSDSYTLQIASTKNDGVEGLIGIVQKDLKVLGIKNIKIVSSCEEVMVSICGLLGCSYKKGKVKFYTQNMVDSPNRNIKEMGLDDEYLLRQLAKPVWGGYGMMLQAGYRFFGLIEDDALLAMCALCRLTAFQTQIIGLETFNDSDKRKGNGKAVSAIAVITGLDCSDIVTWSTELSNEGSCRTALSLGFSPYYENYTAEITLN